MAKSVFSLIELNRSRLEPYLFWTKSITQISDQLNFYKKAAQDWNDNIAYHYVIEYKGSVAGAISVHSISSDRSTCEFGFWIDQKFEGKKIISSAVLAMETTLRDKGFKMIKLRIHKDNIRSILRAEASGYILVSETAESVLRHYIKPLDRIG